MAKNKTNDSVDLLAGISPASARQKPKEKPGGGLKGESAGHSSPLPPLLEYLPIGAEAAWRVEKFELFAAEFGLSGNMEGGWPRQMALFHEAVQGYGRGWLICRRLFGIAPIIPASDSDPSDMWSYSRGEICEQMGFGPDDLQAELDAARAIWNKSSTTLEAKATAQALSAEAPRKELQFGEELMREMGFDESMFNVIVSNGEREVPRAAALNRAEREWFCGRLVQWKKLLKEPMTQALTRETLFTELYLRRIGQEMGPLSPTTSKWRALSGHKQDLERTLAERIESLQKMFPELEVAGKMNFRGVLSDVIGMYQDYYARGDRRRIDRVFTASEIEVLVRGSVQRPAPQYRMGLNLAIIEAMHHIHDPNFRTQFKPQMLKLLDAGFREGVAQMREKLNVPLVDLQKGVLPGEGDDYEDLLVPPEAAAETQPGLKEEAQ